MDEELRYRLASVGGVVVLSGLSVVLVNSAEGQAVAGALPLVARLPADPPGTAEFGLEMATTVVAFGVAFLPLYEPRPRRILDTVALSQRRVVLVMTALAAIGYFDYTYRLPRRTVLLMTPLLSVLLPTWFVWIRRRPSVGTGRVVVGDDPATVERVIGRTEMPLLGYLCPRSAFDPGTGRDARSPAVADGGREPAPPERIGGLSRIEDVLVEYGVETVVLAFSSPDREEFFGTLGTCFELGVRPMVHASQAEAVLTTGVEREEFVGVDLEPWDLQERVFKRSFDVLFALVALVALAPLIAAIAVAIKLDGPGPVFYSQERTAELGDTFTVYKFRSMAPDAEADTGAVLSAEDDGDVDPRVTRVGRVLRATHLDEIPQLWTVLTGEMSVVGPRPERPELDRDIRRGIRDWQRRWFVKPGLTGLAQVNDVTSTAPDEKLRYDVEYMRRRSLRLDLKLVVRQVWKMLAEFRGRNA